MPTPKKPGRGRFEIIAEPNWVDLVARAAKEMGHGSASAYARIAINKQLRADGYDPMAAPARPRGRPRKGSDQAGGTTAPAPETTPRPNRKGR
jgi:hypothetical protein